MKRILILLFTFFNFYNAGYSQKELHHFIFFSHERDRIQEKSFLENENIKGAQLKYTWRELEPAKDQYNLELIQRDLDFLTSNGKKLFIQLQDVSFDTIFKCVPGYIMQDAVYNGGADIQYITGEGDKIIKQDGWVARRWDTAVAERFFKLLFVLGKNFDGRIEGINLPETSVGFGSTGKLFPKGFSHDVYKNTIIQYMSAARKAFSRSIVIQYANFVPGEWLGGLGYLISIRDGGVDLSAKFNRVGHRSYFSFLAGYQFELSKTK